MILDPFRCSFAWLRPRWFGKINSFEDMVTALFERQKKIENADEEGFDDYLQNYFNED